MIHAIDIEHKSLINKLNLKCEFAESSDDVSWKIEGRIRVAHKSSEISGQGLFSFENSKLISKSSQISAPGFKVIEEFQLVNQAQENPHSILDPVTLLYQIVNRLEITPELMIWLGGKTRVLNSKKDVDEIQLEDHRGTRIKFKFTDSDHGLIGIHKLGLTLKLCVRWN